MKKIKKLVLLGLVVSLGSCSSYLEETPDNRTEVNSATKISELLTGAYPDASYMQIAELKSDNADDKAKLSATEQLELDMYTYEIPVDDQQDSPIFYWDAAYKAIAQANQALESIEELKGQGESGDDQLDDARSFDDLKGEALLSRAYAHFMLVNLWSKHYDPDTAETDLGIPYITKPETTLVPKYERGTVKGVYDKIEADLQEGLSLVQDNYIQPKYHFTPNAALAFATRFYLFKGEWDKVLEYSNDLLGSSPNKIRDWVAYGSLTFDQINDRFSNVDEPANILIAYTASIYSRRAASSRFGLSVAKVEQLFRQGAANPYGKAWEYPLFTYGNDFTYIFPKFQEYFEYTNINAGIGFVHVPNVLFSYDEVLLARAEAYAMKDQYGSSLTDINLFLKKKTTGANSSDDLNESDVTSQYPVISDEYTPFYAMSDEQTSFVKLIAELKRREYYFEGLRWFDDRRFNIVVNHDVAGGGTITLGKDDNRRQLQIPKNAIATGITPNPR